MANNYDNAAWFYDSLSRMVFGKAIVNTQLYMLQYIPANSNILIVGGGTGWILDEISKLHPTGLTITYVELSTKMIAISTKREIGANNVTFITSAIENVVLQPDFDVVITPFLFDNFSQATAQKVFDHLHSSLKNNGLWLYVDFEPTGKVWQKMALKTMHAFFKILCGIEATKLPDVKHLFAQTHYKSINSKAFFGDFMRATVYSRRS